MKRRLLLFSMLVILLMSDAYAKAVWVFQHGFTSNAGTFAEYSNHLIQQGWTYGGELSVDVSTDRVYQRQPVFYQDHAVASPRAGDFYLTNLSDAWDDRFPSQNLGIREMGRQLKLIVEKAKSLSGAESVILVGHSMGVLAVRSYLQFLRPSFVEHAILLAGPNAGAEVADLADQLFWQAMSAYFKRDINPFSRAIKFFKSDSPELAELNDFASHPFPPGTKISCVLLEGGNVPILPPRISENNDGLLSVATQDLTRLEGIELATPHPLVKFIFQSPSNLVTRELGHSLALKRIEILRAILEIGRETYPAAKLEQDHAAGGTAYQLTLRRAELGAQAEMRIWRDDRPQIKNYDEADFISSEGAALYTGTIPELNSNYTIQFRVNGRVSNALRLEVRLGYYPFLKVVNRSREPAGSEVVVQLTGAPEKKTVTFQVTTPLKGHQEVASVVKTDAKGALFYLLTFPIEETYAVIQAEIDKYRSNQVMVALPPPLELVELRSLLTSKKVTLTGAEIDYLASTLVITLRGTSERAEITFLEPPAFLWAAIQPATAVDVYANLEGGNQVHIGSFSPGAQDQLFMVREGLKITALALVSAAGAAIPWRLTNIFVAFDNRPPLLVTGFDREPILKGQAVGKGWWYNWIYLLQPADNLLVQIEKLEYTFFDEHGAPYLEQLITPAEMIKNGWFQKADVIFVETPFEDCRRAIFDTDKKEIWFGPGRICQDQIYVFRESPVVPRYVQARFHVRDLFGNRQVITNNIMMLPF